MSVRTHIIYVHPQAPAKPREGEPCNGCGVCCLSEPCPLGMLASRRRKGACALVRWEASPGIYRCGAMVDLRASLARLLPLLPGAMLTALASVLATLVRRVIAANTACDCSLGASAPT
jgi:hypothetical protein